jgi:hypothetical protein
VLLPPGEQEACDSSLSLHQYFVHTGCKAVEEGETEVREGGLNFVGDVCWGVGGRGCWGSHHSHGSPLQLLC